jgi:hypothetical protein
MEWYLYVAIVAAGFVCGFINTLSGSGSLITLPLLMLLGLPANVANGTNRVAILLQNVVGVNRFHKKGLLDTRRGLILAVPAAVGAILGAQIAVSLDEELMRRTIGVLLAIMLVVILVRPKRWLEGRPELLRQRPTLMQYWIFFAIGVYGGFIQAGVGIFLLAGLVLGAGFDLVRANAVKVLIVLCFTAFALVVFLVNDQVRWEIGLVLALGNMSGAWVAVHAAASRGAEFVRDILIAVVAIAAFVLLGLPNLLRSIL